MVSINLFLALYGCRAHAKDACVWWMPSVAHVTVRVFLQASWLKMKCKTSPLPEDASKRHPFPCPTTYRTALSHYLDITSIPRANVLKELAEYAEDEEEKKKLLLMGSNTPEGKARILRCYWEKLFSVHFLELPLRNLVASFSSTTFDCCFPGYVPSMGSGWLPKHTGCAGRFAFDQSAHWSSVWVVAETATEVLQHIVFTKGLLLRHTSGFSDENEESYWGPCQLMLTNTNKNTWHSHCNKTCNL